MKLEHSVVLITGAAMRVGKEVALYFASKGANIAFSYYEENEPWQQTQQEIEALGAKCFVKKVEIRDRAEIHAFVQETKQQFGRIDVLFNNASVWLRKPFLEISEEEWDLAQDVNLKGPFPVFSGSSSFNERARAGRDHQYHGFIRFSGVE